MGTISRRVLSGNGFFAGTSAVGIRGFVTVGHIRLNQKVSLNIGRITGPILDWRSLFLR